MTDFGSAFRDSIAYEVQKRTHDDTYIYDSLKDKPYNKFLTIVLGLDRI